MSYHFKKNLGYKMMWRHFLAKLNSSDKLIWYSAENMDGWTVDANRIKFQ